MAAEPTIKKKQQKNEENNIVLWWGCSQAEFASLKAIMISGRVDKSVCYWNGRLKLDCRLGRTKDYKN